MEALALLCTLHADGPATLKRLRRAGCDSLRSLESYEPESLADLLGLSPAAARRFGREARMLDARLTTGILEREEAPETVLRASVETDTYRGDTGSLDRRDRDLLGKVLAKWKESDAVEPAPVREPEPITAAPAPAREVHFEQQPPSEQAEQAVETVALAPGLLAGMTADHVACLDELGITGLAELTAAPSLELAKGLCESFALVRRWQFLAGRIESEAAAVAEVPSTAPAAAAQRTVPSAPAQPARPERSVAAAPPPLTVRKPWPVQAVAPSRPSAATPRPEQAPEVAEAPEAPKTPVGSWRSRTRSAAPSFGPASEPAPVRVPRDEQPVPLPPATAPRATADGIAPEPRPVRRGWTPRKFWEAPKPEAVAPGPSAVAEVAEPAREPEPASARSRGQTTLNWNFEIPPPPPIPPAPTVTTEPEQAGGPFA
ncbi:MAG: hypothetical protein GY711_18705 [bacterium]|nr:hypothetical protein [bacterium]